MWNKAINNPEHENEVLLLTYDTFEHAHQLFIGSWYTQDKQYTHYGDKSRSQIVVAWQELPSYKEEMLTQELKDIIDDQNFINRSYGNS
jgi:hypothetical protein